MGQSHSLGGGGERGGDPTCKFLNMQELKFLSNGILTGSPEDTRTVENLGPTAVMKSGVCKQERISRQFSQKTGG